jgi:RNA 3'-terminal phosphate cyclase
VDDVWWYGGAPDTVHIRTAEANPQAVMHLPDPMQAVIVEGVVQRTNPTPELAQRMAETANAKYAHYGLKNDASTYATAQGLVPSRVLAWSAFPSDATRFEFNAG